MRMCETFDQAEETTGGLTSLTHGSDIICATLFERVWELVEEEFPGADLYLQIDLQAFLADMT